MSDRYNLPAAGQRDWHEPLNENFRNIGADIDALEKTVTETVIQPDETLPEVIDTGGPGRYVLAPGAHELDRTVELGNGQRIVGGRDSEIRVTADVDCIKFVGDNPLHHSAVRDLYFDLNPVGDGEYGSSLVLFGDTPGRQNPGLTHVKNVHANGWNAAGEGSTGIHLRSTDTENKHTGVGWVMVENVRPEGLEYGVHLETGGGNTWVNGNTIWNLAPWGCRVGVKETITGGGPDGWEMINGNTYRVLGNGHERTERFFELEGEYSTVYAQLWDSFVNECPDGAAFGTERGEHNCIYAHGHSIEPFRGDACLTGEGSRIVSPACGTYEWSIGPGLPNWLTETGDGNTSYEYSWRPEYNIETTGSAGDTVEISPGGQPLCAPSDAPNFETWMYPHWDSGPRNMRAFVGIESESGNRYGIFIDSEDELGTGITDSWIAYADGPAGVQYEDTGIPNDVYEARQLRVDRYRRTAGGAMDEWYTAVGVNGGERVLEYGHNGTDAGATYPIIELSQVGADGPRHLRLSKGLYWRHRQEIMRD